MMPLLRFLFRKMWKNRWLTFSSFIGLTLAVAFTSSIPMYTDSALKRIISVSLQEDSSAFPPGSLLMRYQAASHEFTEPESILNLNRFINEHVPRLVGYSQVESVGSYSLSQSLILPVTAAQSDSRRRQMSIMAQTDLAEHVSIITGSMFQTGGDAETVEAVVWEEALYRNHIQVGDLFRYTVSTRFGTKTINVKIVGAFQPVDEQSDYWYQGLGAYANILFVDDTWFEETLLLENEAYISTANWYYLFDLSTLQPADLGRLQKNLSRLEPELFQILRNSRVDISFVDKIREFRQKSLQLQSVLFMLAAPMLGMCFYYIFINARQSLERQRNDISVLRSRGAGKHLIYKIYVLESMLLGGTAWIAGLLLGAAMANLIGMADGFLQFAVGKESFIQITGMARLYGLMAVIAAMLAGTLPVISYAKMSIVNFKQHIARADRKPLWQRWYLDVALVIASGYGWYMFQSQQLLSSSTGLSPDQLQVQPVIFFIPALAVFSLGLLFLRIFPMMIQLFHRILRKWMPVTFHLVLIQLSRSEKAYYPLMILLILTLGLGEYHASAARTMNLNTSDRLMYFNGADVDLQPVWEGVEELYDDDGYYIEDEQSRTVNYIEPPIEPFLTLPGVQAHARVLLQQGDLAAAGKSLGKGTLMAVHNVEFAHSAWFRHDLFALHPYTQLRLLGVYEHAAIVSKSFADKNSLKTGDLVQMTVQSELIEFVIVAVTEYWPGLDPKNFFLIANLDYIYGQIPLTPYSVWLKMEDGAKVMPVIQYLKDHEIYVSSVRDVRNELVQHKREPSREGIFGILSLGFIVSLVVSFIGYLLFWIFSLAQRTVQMGILRATGLSRGQLTFMLLIEQLLTTGLSILLGIGIGRGVSRLFLPFLQVNGQSQVPPFIIVFEQRDTLQLLATVLMMLVIGAVFLVAQIRRMRVHQAVKLGEER